MFSNKKIADYVNNNFEATWKSVAPVPKVTIDFGGGRKIERTVYGNIATYVCTAGGYIVDILPGIYQPDNYLQSLTSIKAVHRDAIARTNVSDFLQKYHFQNTSLSVLEPAQEPGSFNSSTHFQLLGKDTLNNEVLRRNKVHTMLAAANLVQPTQIYKKLYRDVLDVDIEDPYLGMKSRLDKNYPFDDPNS